jgi:hypothetical protein
MLAKAIVDKNEEGKEPHVNLRGFAVGNPYTVGVTRVNIMGLLETIVQCRLHDTQPRGFGNQRPYPSTQYPLGLLT